MKKKILYIIDSFGIGGREYVVASLSNHINKDLYSVSILVLNDSKDNYLQKINNDIEVSFINRSKHERGVFYFFKTLLKTRMYLREYKPDIIHTHLFYFDLFIVALASFGIKIKFFQTIHTSGLYYSNKGLSNYFKLLIEKLSYMIMRNIELVSISKSVEYFVKINFYKFNCNLIYNGIDVNNFKPKKTKESLRIQYNLPLNKSIIIYLSRLDIGKNHEFVIEQIKNDFDNSLFLFVGDGILYNKCKKLIDKYKLQDKVILWGASNNVKDLLNLSDIAIFPSSFEGFSIVLLELLASYLPVLVSDIEPFKEIIIENENGVVFELDSNNFKEKLNLLIKDSILCEKLKENGFKTAQRFDISKMVSKHQIMYDRKN